MTNDNYIIVISTDAGDAEYACRGDLALWQCMKMAISILDFEEEVESVAIIKCTHEVVERTRRTVVFDSRESTFI